MAAEIEFTGIILLQPEFVFEERKINVSELSKYIDSVQTNISSNLSSIKGSAISGHVVIAVRMGGKSKAWIDFSEQDAKDIHAPIVSAVEDVKAFKVAEGTILFAISMSINGANAVSGMPMPVEWSNAMSIQKESLEMEQLVDVVWP